MITFAPYDTATKQLSGVERVAYTAELILAEYGEGTPFFDAMDASLRRSAFMDILLDEFAARFGASFDLVVSGKFGAALCAYLANEGRERLERQLGGRMPLLLPGNLRHTSSLPLDSHADRISGRLFVMADDSMYKARTRDLIRTEMRKVGGRLMHSLILYDGSALKHDDVTGFYRYFDHHPEKNPLLQPHLSAVAARTAVSR